MERDITTLRAKRATFKNHNIWIFCAKNPINHNNEVSFRRENSNDKFKNHIIWIFGAKIYELKIIITKKYLNFHAKINLEIRAIFWRKNSNICEILKKTLHLILQSIMSQESIRMTNLQSWLIAIGIFRYRKWQVSPRVQKPYLNFKSWFWNWFLKFCVYQACYCPININNGTHSRKKS